MIISSYKTGERLASLDILRGFDMFLLVFFQPVFIRLARHWPDVPVVGFLQKQFSHADWVGFSFWDLVMPLFLFMVGTAMPFSFAKYNAGSDKFKIYRRILRRVFLLFVLGMVIQGNLLSLDPQQFRLYSNTLQAIAAGYLMASVLLLHVSNRHQYSITALLLVVYWALLTFMGDFSPEGNFAEKVDQAVLGRFRDGVRYDGEGNWTFNPGYRYTWILSSLTFGVTVMLGVFAGRIMKNGTDRKKNSLHLLLWGVGLLISGWLLGYQTPIIKKIWSASMTLFSGGLCFLLMALFYYIIDYKGWSKGLNWLKFYGMNAIVAYTLGQVINFRSAAHSLLWGLERYMDGSYQVLLTFANFFILFLILRVMFKTKTFVTL